MKELQVSFLRTRTNVIQFTPQLGVEKPAAQLAMEAAEVVAAAAAAEEE